MEKKRFFEKEAFLITMLIFIPFFTFSNFLLDFVFPKGTHFSDYSISHFPNLLYLQHALVNYHQIPLWNGQILSGFPNLADPLSGLWYPGNWLSILFPLPFGTQMVTVFHLISAGIGMYLFLRQQKMTTFGAFFGAMAFELMPKMFAHFVAGHVSLVHAITWTPWILYLQQRRYERQPNQSRFWYGVAPIYGLILLCDVRWAAYAAILDFVYFLKFTWQSRDAGWKQAMIRLAGWISQILVGVLLAGIFIVPFLQYVSLTDRSVMTASDILNYSLPLSKMMGIMIPDMGGYAEYTIYPGMAIWICFLGVLTVPELRKKYGLMYIYLSLWVLYAISGTFPGMSWVASIPGLNLIRVPSRIFLVIATVMIIMTGDYLSSIEKTQDVKKQVNLLPGFFTMLFTCAILAIVLLNGDVMLSDFTWPVAISVLLFFLFLGKKYFYQRASFFYFALVIISIFDFTVVNASQYDSYDSGIVLSQDNDIFRLLSTRLDEYARVYSPSYRMEQQLTAVNAVPLVDGIDPLHLASYAAYMEKATGVEQKGYSVTIPYFETGKAQSDNADAIPDTIMLGRLNAQYIVSTFPIQSSRLSLVSSANLTYIYQNLDNYPHAWVEQADKVYLNRVSDLKITPNRIILSAAGPGTLVLSEIAYPGWKASINGHAASIDTAYDVLRAVQLQDGENNIILQFQPDTLYIGIGITLFTILIILVFEFIGTFTKDEQDGE